MKNHFNLIERYIYEEINDDEKKQVEFLLKNDKNFAKEFQFRSDVNEAISENDILNLRKTIKELYHKNSHRNTKNVIRKLYSEKWYLAAAAIAILFTFGTILISSIQKPFDSSKLFDKFYTNEHNIMITRSLDIHSDEYLNSALQLYANTEYNKAITILENLRGNMFAEFYLGLSYIEIQNYYKAKETFNSVISHADNIFIEQAKWYAALCSLKLNSNQEEIIQLFTEIKNSNSVYKCQAADILKFIK